MIRVRPAVFAGSFYPAAPQVLIKNIEAMLNKTSRPIIESIKAFIVPHAGYIYSGQIAAEVFRQLKSTHQNLKNIVLIGPSHRVWFKGLSVPSAEKFATPLGEIDLNCEQIKQLIKKPQVHVRDDAHQQEHCLEVQLPFIQYLFKQIKIIPIVVGETTTAEIIEVLECYWDDPQTVILVSSDLSHFHDYQTAKNIDQTTQKFIESFDYQSIENQMACGSAAIKAVLKMAKQKSMQITHLGYCNSGDTAGDINRVVGYAAYAIH